MTNFPLDSYRESCRTESMVDAEMFGSGEGREGFEGSAFDEFSLSALQAWSIRRNNIIYGFFMFV